MTDFIWSTSVSITAIGGLIGAMVGPILADMFGRYTEKYFAEIVIIVITL